MLAEIPPGTRMQRAATLEVRGPGVKVLGRRVKLPDAVGMLTNKASDGIHHGLRHASKVSCKTMRSTVPSRSTGMRNGYRCCIQAATDGSGSSCLTQQCR